MKKRAKHVAIIPDGHRRWAEKNSASLIEAYQKSKSTLSDIVSYLFENEVDQVTIYLLSKENIDKRTPDDLTPMYYAIEHGLKHEIANILSRYDAELNICGVKLEGLKIADNWMNRTQQVKGKRLNLCINYNPYVEAFQLAKEASSVDEFQRKFSVKNDIDLLIRTGGANTLSNFVPLQLGYARLYFLDTLFNDIRLTEIELVLKEFCALPLKYGE